MKIARRELTYQRETPWPFLYSVVQGKVVRNVQPVRAQTRKKIDLKKLFKETA